MYIFKTVVALQQFLNDRKEEGKKIGFAPTMGALHQGHLSLIRESQKDNQISVCSIFVNPKQFNDPNDYNKYPITTNADIELLESVDCDVLFLPSISEIYPNHIVTKINIDIGHFSKVMEGEFRPGHFQGMMEVVKRLLEIVQPDNLYMGQKDFQQFSIIRLMIQKLSLPYHLVMCPIKREADGLAMSSRNVRLTPEGRENAHYIYDILCQAKSMVRTHTPTQIEEWAMDSLYEHKGFKPEYFRIVDVNTLLPVWDWNDAEDIIACVATWIDDVRLIDNMVLKP
ncbi:MAG: pantoate--beta-alanine ligase [Saprospiraceae bacterium]|nr:pantoate--beta-alanine ligase [Saprospiraceae bacterium]